MGVAPPSWLTTSWRRTAACPWLQPTQLVRWMHEVEEALLLLELNFWQEEEEPFGLLICWKSCFQQEWKWIAWWMLVLMRWYDQMKA
mmetsp:Transcript_31937/g.74780  ORF Transcript_31937/g.74780 Transcript_31937/m.74780 type:complete len:87 (+) Transcript_31937:272-532(+)